MRTLHVTDSFLPKVGGAEQAIDRLVRALSDNGCPSSVLAQINRGIPTKVDVPYPVARYSRPRTSLWAGWWIGNAIRKFERDTADFDVLIGHHAFPPGYAVVEYARKRHRKAVVHIRGGDIYHGSRFRTKKLAWSKLTAALRDAHAVVALSGAMRDLVLEICPEAKVRIIPNGVDIESHTADASSSKFARDDRLRGPFILGLGRAVKRKGFHLLIDAFALVSPPGWKLVIAGDGRDLDELKKIAAPLGDKVLFTGMVTGPDKYWLLQNCRFSCAPSIEESFPNVALEALACGKPVLGSTAGGFADLITPGVQGLLTPIGDIPALAEGIRHLTTADLTQMSQSAGRRAQSFTWPSVGQQYANLLRSL